MERKKYLLQNVSTGNCSVISITEEQSRLLNWLYDNDWVREELSYGLLEEVECEEI